MPYPRMGRTERLTIRLRPDDAERLRVAAQVRGVAQTVILEELIRTLPETPSAESPVTSKKDPPSHGGSEM